MTIQNSFIVPAKKEKNTIIPIFIPFFGCPQICIFCNQELQTGSSHDITIQRIDYSQKLSSLLNNTLEDIKKCDKPEIAFFGGTFSALPSEDFNHCLDFVYENKSKGLISKARCSTRPDALSDNKLKIMKEKGIDTIELGIQSFSSHALKASNRNYTKEIALEACKKVKEYGFNLGVQLMPNLYGQEEDEFLKDIEISLNYADFLRFYPCLVVEGTKLATLWKDGKHKVWSFEKTTELLAQALFISWQAKIPVIRIGVAYEENFYNNLLAGIYHQSLGQLVQEKALMLAIEKIFSATIQEAISENSTFIWHIPLLAKGFLSLKNNKDFYAKHHINNASIKWHEGEEIIFEII